MAFNPGRNVGRVSIRVLPDTKNFNRDLRRQLNDAARTTKARIRIDGADFDQAKIRADIERQVAGMKGIRLDALAEVTVDRAKLKKTALRKSIQEQFDQFDDIRVKIAAEIANPKRFHDEVRRMVNDASNMEVKISANANTFAASQQFRYVARDRFVTFFANVNEASLAKVATALAAVSGARLAYTWVDDIADFAKDLDKTLPTILNWTTGITSGFAAVAAAVSGLVGIGQGLFSIAPALLVLPGLALNAVGSLIALIVAWRNAGTELGSLGDGMRELGDIINTTYWDRARQPILDLVNGLMPQLRNSFRDLASGVGDFTASLANAFGVEFGEGRLESIFAGISEGWRVLATGAEGFAGAIVSLSQVAAKYTPRLAGWFVRQANTFDSWLESVSTDGRLDAWMERAIDSMYDVWDVTTGLAGVFEGLWKAADLAGSGGLAGFAELMLTWERTVKSADFQKGLSAVFRGSYVAMDAFGEAIKAVGRLFADLDGSFEKFIGSSGIFLGGLVEAAADALNSASFDIGLTGFADGMIDALAGIKPSLQPIADTFGNFLGLLGDLAANLLPTAAGVLADLMPAIDTLIDAVGKVLPGLSDSVGKISDALGPAFERVAEALSPVLIQTFELLADTLERIAPDLASMVSTVGPALADALSAAVDILAPVLGNIDLSVNATALPYLGNPMKLFDLANAEGMNDLLKEIEERGGVMADWADLALQIGAAIGEAAFQIGGFARQVGDAFADIVGKFQSLGIEAMAALLGGFETAFPGVTAWLSNMGVVMQSVTSGAIQWLRQTGTNIILGLFAGLQVSFFGVQMWLGSLGGQMSGALGATGNILVGAGRNILNGLLAGLRSAWEGVKEFISGIGPWIAENKGPAAYDKALLVPAGGWIMGGLEKGLERGFGRVKSRVSGMANEIRDQFGIDMGAGVSASVIAARAASRALGGDTPDGSGGFPRQVNVTMPLLPGETPREQRERVVKELAWVS